jgi:hypothetical protein
MGLLDDAIRDHLDLKRRRGGDPTEIERAEHEALGPVRRDPFERVGGDLDGVSVPDEGPRAYDREEDSYDDERHEEHVVEEEREQEYEAPPGAGEPAAPPSYPTEAGAGDETMQYDVEEALASEPAAAKHAPEWVEQSDEWVEQSEEWVEPSHPVETPAADLSAPESGRESAYLESPDDEAAPGAPPPEPRSQHPAKPEDDVFDEAPEFPQDAPDDDRLWFEQRPPRNLDFDS